MVNMVIILYVLSIVNENINKLNGNGTKLLVDCIQPI